MTKPLQIPAVVAPVKPRRLTLTPPNPAHITISFRRYRPEIDPPPKQAFEQPRGPRSVILFKIIAMEKSPANAPRLTRRSQFVKRLGPLVG